eukprot:TRINITY_DN638_c0_g1_i1.p3 TRINITY_DN638_c0_g1~~TRINITY_DN638_c0_g1_i1.p3  ORF type:complete len:165 (+),score=3.20 TRINITY_DN638_c0_g1_i1:464-958(+)
MERNGVTSRMETKPYNTAANGIDYTSLTPIHTPEITNTITLPKSLTIFNELAVCGNSNPATKETANPTIKKFDYTKFDILVRVLQNKGNSSTDSLLHLVITYLLDNLMTLYSSQWNFLPQIQFYQQDLNPVLQQLFNTKLICCLNKTIKSKQGRRCLFQGVFRT